MATMKEWNRKYYQEMFYASQNHEEEANLHESGKHVSVYEKHRSKEGYCKNR
jgi:hypothetical protein